MRTIELPAGTPVIQAIETIILQSSYIRDRLLVKDKEQLAQINDADSNSVDNTSPKVLSWFNINTSAEVIDFDEVRNMYAYKITYKISKYEVPYLLAAGAGVTSKYYGPHKIYDYWYTGKNTSVLSYEVNYNSLYYNAVSINNNSVVNKLRGVPNNPVYAQNEDPTSLFSGAMEQINSVKSFLYSMDDQVKAHIKIMGDPDFLMPTVNDSIGAAYSKWYGKDFTVNPNHGQVFIEINFKQASDYDNSIGLLTGGQPGDIGPNGNIDFYKYPADVAPKTSGIIYIVIAVKSLFVKGSFTQEFHVMMPIWEQLTDITAPSNSNSSTSTAGGREQPSENGNGNGHGTLSMSGDNGSSPRFSKNKTDSKGGSGRGGASFAETDPRRIDQGDNGQGAIKGTQQAATGVSADDDENNFGNSVKRAVQDTGVVIKKWTNKNGQTVYGSDPNDGRD